jgi:hypothetical protein
MRGALGAPSLKIDPQMTQMAADILICGHLRHLRIILLRLSGPPSAQGCRGRPEVFCFFFSKKEALSYFLLKPFALDALTFHFAGAADGFGGFAGAAFGGFFVVPAEFHFAEHAFALKLFFERLQRLVDVIVANENLHLADYS